MFTKSDLERLIRADSAPAVSLFMPTHSAGRETRQDPIRFRNLMGAALERLTDGGMRRPDAEAMLAPALAWADDALFWRHQDRGLAVFIGGGVAERHRVPLDLPEEVTVARGFALRHLLPLLAADGAFMILALTAASARLYAASRHGLAEEEVERMPPGVQAVHAETDYDQKSLHAAPPARHVERRGVPKQMVKTHNFGESPEELRHAHFIEYLRRVSDSVERHLAAFPGPLVLVADEEIQGHVRALPHPRALLAEGVTVNPDALDEAEIHRRAYAVAEPLFDRGRRDALDRFRAVNGDPNTTGRAATTVEAVVRAARQGRVDVLLVAGEGRLWGRYDPMADRVEVRSSPDGDAVDLLEDAMAQSMLHGGPVHIVDKDELPPGSLTAAVLRF